MKKSISAYILTVVGVGLLAGGVYFIKTIEDPDPQGMLGALPYLYVG